MNHEFISQILTVFVSSGPVTMSSAEGSMLQICRPLGAMKLDTFLQLVMVHERVKPVFGTKCCKQNSKDDKEEEEADESRHAQQYEVVPAAPCTWLNSIQGGWGTWLFF